MCKLVGSFQNPFASTAPCYKVTLLFWELQLRELWYIWWKSEQPQSKIYATILKNQLCAPKYILWYGIWHICQYRSVQFKCAKYLLLSGNGNQNSQPIRTEICHLDLWTCRARLLISLDLVDYNWTGAHLFFNASSDIEWWLICLDQINNLIWIV